MNRYVSLNSSWRSSRRFRICAWIETSSAETVYTHAEDDYTKALLAAVPIPDPHKMRARREERRKLKDVLAEPV